MSPVAMGACGAFGRTWWCGLWSGAGRVMSTGALQSSSSASSVASLPVPEVAEAAYYEQPSEQVPLSSSPRLLAVI